MVCRLKDNSVIAATPEERLKVTQIVLKRGLAFRLLVFRLVDSHLHFHVAESLRASMELARRIEVGISLALYPTDARDENDQPVGFARAFPTEIRNQAHLFNAFDYILRQSEHHRLSWDAHAAASNLPDLLGLRLLGDYTADVARELLPRKVTRQLLLRRLGVEEIAPQDGPLEYLHQAVCASIGLTTLTKKTSSVRAAQIAAVNVVKDRLPTPTLAEFLEIAPRTVQRMRKNRADPRLEQAIRLQLTLHATLDTSTTGGAFSA